MILFLFLPLSAQRKRVVRVETTLKPTRTFSYFIYRGRLLIVYIVCKKTKAALGGRVVGIFSLTGVEAQRKLSVVAFHSSVGNQSTAPPDLGGRWQLERRVVVVGEEIKVGSELLVYLRTHVTHRMASRKISHSIHLF